MPDIIESPVIKIVFNDHLRIWSFVLGVTTEGRFEGDENVVSISVSEVTGITHSFKVHIYTFDGSAYKLLLSGAMWHFFSYWCFL